MKREKERSQIENSGKRSFSRLLFIRVPSEGWSENRLDENVMINERENNSIARIRSFALSTRRHLPTNRVPKTTTVTRRRVRKTTEGKK